ncbi:MAG: hypothetical protein NTX25_09980 [Proteobacteria bacterium]|nr:hypothetical protein [Pseudomonadota bacterium]
MKNNYGQVPIRLVHWNIRELDSMKLSEVKNAQVEAASSVLEHLRADILSINEIHYDTERAQQIGRDNLQDFLQRFPSGQNLIHQCFAPANTGSRAQRDEHGQYLRDTPLRGHPHGALIDRSNYGLFPGQYASGLATHFPIQSKQIIQDLLWRDWQPDILQSEFQWAGVGPESLELFDKSLSISYLDCMGTSLAIVCLHAVPAFNFGQNKSPNAARNAAQLNFLEWFLLGKPTLSPSILKRLEKAGIQPLSPSQRFIAVGDFNCPLHENRYPGSQTLQRLLTNPRIQARQAKIPPHLIRGTSKLKTEHTYFSSGWDLGKLPTQLDYILVSQGLEIKTMETVFAAPELQVHAFLNDAADAEAELACLQAPGRSLALQKQRDAGGRLQTAIVSVNRSFAELRAASDHLPLCLDFKITELHN